MTELIRRNLRLYLRDRMTVFFSLLSVIIVVLLYVLFLAQLQIDSIKSAVTMPLSDSDISWLIDSWIAAGILSIVPVTSCLGSLGMMVTDKEKRIVKDFRSSPMRQFKYPLAAVCAAGVVSCAMSLVAFAIFGVYIYLNSGHSFTFAQYGRALALILLTSVFACTVMGLIAALFRTSSSFVALNIVVGTVIGFVNGVYVPLGILPDAVQTAVKVLPFGHSTVAFRQVLMSDALSTVFAGAPPSALDHYREMYGIAYWVGGAQLGFWWSVAYLGVMAAVAFSLFVLVYSRQNRSN